MRKLALLPLVAALAITGCGGDDDESSGSSSVPEMSLGPTTTFAPTPEVSLPEEIPSKLGITDLTTGEGPKAKKGDLVMVHYVGVRSEDGTEFDGNFANASGFPVTLGAGGVIKGWDRGLVGVQPGGVRQLDIPAKLAYGDSPPEQQDIIKAGDALSFVVQVDVVIAPPDEKQLKKEIEPSTGASETTTVDLVDGTGAELTPGKTASLNIIALRGDNEVVLENSWTSGQPLSMQLVEGGALPGLVQGLEGMKVGGRRVVTMPPADAYGDEGNPTFGLPRDTDFIVIADLLAVS